MPLQPERASIQRTRFWFQVAVLLVTLAMGLQFHLFVIEAAGPGPVNIERPAGVEGFLPIGGLMGWKLFATTGKWDPVHPAAMVILGWAALASLVLRKAFCGWFCPVGALSEWLFKAGGRLFGRNFAPPRWVDLPLRGLKYLLLGFFLWVIGNMSAAAMDGFLAAPYYQVSDVKMLHFFTRMSLATALVLAGLAALSLMIKNFWCRYLCPYGALMGLLALLGPTRVRRETAKCTNCGRCAAACPNHLPVDRKTSIVSPECNACLACLAACPAPGALRLATLAPRIPPWKAPALALALGLSFLVLMQAAQWSGHWQSSLPLAQFRLTLAHIDSPSLRHPSLAGPAGPSRPTGKP